jgi:hypothetical protein
VPAHHVWSGGVQLPAVIVEPGAEATFSVQTAILFQDDTDPFEVRIGEMTVETIGLGMADPTFGQEAT